MPDPRITAHAIERFQERVANVSAEQVVAMLDTPTMRIAIAFGAKFVRLPSGHRLVIADQRVVTVLPPDHFRRQIHRTGLGRYGKTHRAHWKGGQP